MTGRRVSKLTGALAATVLALACGNTTTLGQVLHGDDGGGATSGGGGTSSPGGASGSFGTSGESGAAGASGTAGAASGGTSGTAGTTATDAGPPCRVPQPAPIPNPTSEQMQRATLIHDYCVTLTRDNCLEVLARPANIYSQARGCSIEGRITACEQDRLYEYVQGVGPACDEEWQAAVRCVAARTYSGACEGARLIEAPPVVCDAEKNALIECAKNNVPWETITGSRTTCLFSTSGLFAACDISCPDSTYDFTSPCGGPAGLPVRCGCFVNERELGDLDWDTSVFYANDCSDAARRLADGEWCTNRMDCCLEWTQGSEKRCQCGSEKGCANAAQNYGATRVDRCPQYL